MKPVQFHEWSHFIGFIDACFMAWGDPSVWSRGKFVLSALYPLSQRHRGRSVDFLDQSLGESRHDDTPFSELLYKQLGYLSADYRQAPLIVDLTSEKLSSRNIPDSSQTSLITVCELLVSHPAPAAILLSLGVSGPQLVEVIHPAGSDQIFVNSQLALPSILLSKFYILELKGWGQARDNSNGQPSKSGVSLFTFIKAPMSKIERRRRTFSVMMPVYNHHDLLPDAIDSVEKAASGWESAVEIVVVDDGSDQRPDTVMSQLPTTYLKSERNFGVSNALNRAKNAAQGEFICWLSADDLYLPNFFVLREILLAFSPNLNCFFSTPNTILTHLHNRIVRPSITGRTYTRESIIAGSIYGIGVNGITMTVARDLARPLEFSERFRHAQDVKFWFDLAMRTEALVGTIPVPTTLSRLSLNTVTSRFQIVCEIEALLAVIWSNTDAEYYATTTLNREMLGEKLALVVGQFVISKDDLMPLRVIAIAALIWTLGFTFMQSFVQKLFDQFGGLNRQWYEKILPLIGVIEARIKNRLFLEEAIEIGFQLLKDGAPEVLNRWQTVASRLRR